MYKNIELGISEGVLKAMSVPPEMFPLDVRVSLLEAQLKEIRAELENLTVTPPVEGAVTTVKAD